MERLYFEEKTESIAPLFVCNSKVPATAGKGAEMGLEHVYMPDIHFISYTGSDSLDLDSYMHLVDEDDSCPDSLLLPDLRRPRMDLCVSDVHDTLHKVHKRKGKASSTAGDCQIDRSIGPGGDMQAELALERIREQNRKASSRLRQKRKVRCLALFLNPHTVVFPCSEQDIHSRRPFL
jgi:hypothetical protein